MKKPATISIEDARYLALHNQMLLDNHLPRTKKDLLEIIRQISYVQIDTISIIERAHKHVLWARFPMFKNEILDELIDKDKKIIEFWDHAAAYMPIEYYRYSAHHRNEFIRRHKHWADKNKKLVKYVYERIKREGPLQSRDFEDPQKRGMWWDWKPAKDALEFLFHSGKLAAKARRNFQKVYDLPERVFPSKTDISPPTDEEHSKHLINKAINANGFASEKEMTYLRYHNRSVTKKVLAALIEDKKIIPLGVEGIDEKYYTTTRILKQLNTQKENNAIHILSPFDNLVIQRKRLSTLFNFDFVIECYVPAPKRKFGYFCMPVLYGNKFIGRLDAKAERQTNTFNVINMFWEKPFKERKARISFMEKFNESLHNLAMFAGCNIVSYKQKQ